MNETNSLLDLAKQWGALVPVKWDEARQAQGVFISWHSPQQTGRIDSFCRKQASSETKKWTENWFLERGHKIECVIMPDGEGLGIRQALEGTPPHEKT